MSRFNAVTYRDYGSILGPGIYQNLDMRLHNVELGVYTIVRNVAAFCSVIGMIVAVLLFVYASFGDNRAMAQSKQHLIRTIALVVFIFGCVSMVAFFVSAFGMDKNAAVWLG